MLRCSYIILIHNNQDNIIKLVESLKKVEGNFLKEFIFIDDGSSDNSLDILKKNVRDMSRTTIISQEMQGPTISINKAFSLVTGEYIQFVEGNEILHPHSTATLMDSCLKFGTDVAVGLVSKNELSSNKINNYCKIISEPILGILNGQYPYLRLIGKSGSMIHTKLLEKINKADSSIYTHHMSLSLACAKYSKFAFINDYVSSHHDMETDDHKFNSYNNLKSTYNFIIENPEILINIIPSLFKMLSIEVGSRRHKIKYLLKSLISKYIKLYSLNDVLSFYKQELDKLF